jgi:hypothetical protein
MDQKSRALGSYGSASEGWSEMTTALGASLLIGVFLVTPETLRSRVW